MNFIDKMVEQFMKVNRRMKRWQRVVSVLAAIVVFITTYSLVLPAITLDKDTASTQAGIEVAASDNEAGSDGTVFEAEPEAEEPAEEPAEEAEEPAEEPAEEAEEPAEAPAVEESGSESGSEDAVSAETAGNGETAAPEDGTEEAAKTLTAEEAATYATTEEAIAAVTGQTVEEVKLITEDTQLVYNGSDYKVYADFGKSAKLPEGVELKVREITKESDPDAYQMYYEKALSEMQGKYDENTSLSFARFYDISFVYEGVEIEPSGNVQVRIEYKKAVEIEESNSVDTIHFDKNNDEKPEVIDSETAGTEKEVEAVEFKSDQFSVFGVVVAETITVDYLSKDGNTYEITVDLTDATNIPKEAELDIRELAGDEYDQYLADAATELGVEVDSIAKAKLFDIKIKNGGESIQPNGTVKVDIKLKDETFEKASVVHFGDETEVLYADVVDDVVSFETTGFSIYAIVESDGLPQPPRVTFEFSDPNNPDFTFIDKAGHEQTTQIIKDGEKLQDVGLPTIPEGETFNGWFIYNGETPVEAITFDNAISVAYGETSSVSASSITINPDDLNEDGTYHVQVKAFFGEVVYLTFYEDAAGTNILNRIQIAKGSEYNIATQTVTAPNSELAFQGWNETAGTNDDDRQPITSTTITFNEDDSFYPIFKSGHWITFYAGATGSGADYTAPVFVIAGDTATAAQPSNPEWKGYAFQYWTETNLYTGENGSYVQPSTAPTRFNFNSELNEAKTLYAYWTPADTTYTVVFWRQDVTDNKNASDSQKNYSFAGQETKEGTTGTTVYAADYSDYTSPDGKIDFSVGYELNNAKSDESVEVRADGKSIINVYFNRKLVTMRFYRTPGTVNTNWQGQVTGYTAPVNYNSNNWSSTNNTDIYTGLFGQTWAQAGYTSGWPTPSSGSWMYYDTDYVNGSNTSNNNYGPFTGMTFLGQFVLPNNVYDADKIEIRMFRLDVTNATMEFYLQNVDGTTYPTTPSDTGTGQRRAGFIFSEKYDGFTVSEYRRFRELYGVWYNGYFYEGNYQGATNQIVYFNSDGTAVQNGDDAWAAAAVDGTVSLARGNNDYFNLQVRYARKHYTLKYLDSVDNTDLSGIQSQDVVYGASLTNYKPAASFVPESQYPGKVWDGKWYKNQACTEEFDWSVTMPNDNMVVYAGWEDVYYKVDIDPNGGTLTEGESTLFWRTYGQTVQRYDDVVRDYAEDPNGNYKYEDFLRSKYEAAGYDPWNYDGYLRTARYVTNDTVTTVQMVPHEGSQVPSGTFTYPYESTRYSYEKGAYALIGWYELKFADGHYGDLNYVTGESLYNFGTGVTHDTYIQAKWRRVGEYHVEYKPDVYLMDADGNINTDDSGIDTTNVPSDGYTYADQSQSSIMRSPDSPITRTVGEGADAESKQFVFKGWYYNGQLYEPSDVFTVLSSLAEDKVIGTDIQKTVYIYPVYQSVDDVPVDVTHIYWYSNWQDTDGHVIEGRTEANQFKDETNNELQPNEAVNIDYIDKLLNGSNAYDGYTFLGWAKSPTAKTPWLTYNKDTGKFSVIKDGVTYDNVTQVAADETLPYEDLYAVWEINKYTVTVTKTVAGTGADQHKGFTFAPVFTGYSGGHNFILAGEETTITDEETGTPITYKTSEVFTGVPYGSTLTLTENQEEAYDTTVKYTVTSNVDGTAIVNPEEVDSTNGATYTIQGDITIAYTNTLKTTSVTVKKSLENPYIDSQSGQDFSFTATYAGSNPITFTVNSNNTDGHTIENVPVGVEMVITEAADEAYAYTVRTAGTNSEDTDETANSYTFTVPVDDETVTFTNTVVTVDGINVTKTDDKTPATGLSGAEFTLTRNNKLDGSGSTWITVADPYSGTLTSGANGVLINAGTLPVGTYKLTESKSPEGYIIKNNEVVFSVADGEDGKIITKISGDNASVSDDGKTLTITNQTGQELPHTGGPGTLFYTLSGLMLILASAMMYGFRMRRGERRIK